MPRTLSGTLRAAMHAPGTDEDLLALLTISHPSITTMRFVRNTTNVTSRGNVYTAYPFDIELPEESDERPVRVALVIDNVLREITDAIANLASAPTIVVEGVLASAPDTVELPAITCSLKNARATPFVVRGELGFEDILDEQYPGHVYNPRDWPAVF